MDLHVFIEVFGPPCEAYALMAHAMEEVKKFLVPVGVLLLFLNSWGVDLAQDGRDLLLLQGWVELWKAGVVKVCGSFRKAFFILLIMIKKAKNSQIKCFRKAFFYSPNHDLKDKSFPDKTLGAGVSLPVQAVGALSRSTCQFQWEWLEKSS